LNSKDFEQDLVILAADGQIEFTLKGLLTRKTILKIRDFSYSIFKHPQHDPGCFKGGPAFLQRELRHSRYALVVFDRMGCGGEVFNSDDLEKDLEHRLACNGWGDRAQVVVIDPELEAWVFASSNRVPQILQFEGSYQDMRRWLEENGLMDSSQHKPADPKKALETILIHTSLPRSSAIYQKLAKEVSFKNCNDHSFLKLTTILQNWFPQE